TFLPVRALPAELSFPFEFFLATAGIVDGEIRVHALAYDHAARRVLHRAPEAFADLVEATRYRRPPGRIPAPALFTAWYILARGREPAFAVGPEVAGRRQVVREPETYREGDELVTVAWTRSPLERHVIRVGERVTVSSEDGDALVRRG